MSRHEKFLLGGGIVMFVLALIFSLAGQNVTITYLTGIFLLLMHEIKYGKRNG